MTTATDNTPSPLESYRQGRDKILNVMLDAVSGLEGSVLDFMHDHEGQVRAAGFDLSEALTENGRLERLVGEQALELETSRSHVCAVPVFQDGLGLDPLDTSITEAVPAVAPETGPAREGAAGDEETARTIAGLRGSLEAEQRISAGLRADLEAEQQISAGLRADVVGRDGRIESLEADAKVSEKNLLATVEAHQEYVRGAQETFDQRLAAEVRTAEAGVRGEAIRIIEAIAADNPALAEASDLFTVAFPAEAAPADKPVKAPEAAVVVAPSGDFFATLPEADLEDPAEPAPATEWEAPAAALPAPGEDFFNLPAPEAAPVLMTLPAPDLADDAITDPNFFDNAPLLEEPAGEPVQAPASEGAPVEAPKSGFFGRKKEDQTV